MTKPVTLSDEAFRVLRANKRPGESDSDVVLRLAEQGGKDPWLIFRTPRRTKAEIARHEWFLKEMREADAKRWDRLQRLRRTGRW